MASLGCPKNLVDSEVILGNLGSAGHVIVDEPETADVIVVNTCGFIDQAKEESIDTILAACGLKDGPAAVRKVIVTGCLGQRYAVDIKEQIPEVDAIVGLGEYDDIGSIVTDVVAADSRASTLATAGNPLIRVQPQDQACQREVGRFRLTPRHYAYVKISEGCDNPCTFCSIPSIRGGFRSKPIAEVEAEVRELVATGASEIILIAQDTTSYGIDLYERYELVRLLETVAAIDGVRWIRLLYAYPASLTDEMMRAISAIPNVLPYVDIPLQHISQKMLRHMGRRLMEEQTRTLLQRLRDSVPGIYLRTTFIVGFPGEDEAEFETLKDFVRDFEFERLGVFAYSHEEGTPSAEFAEQIPDAVKKRRFEELMLIQQDIAFRHNTSRVGGEVEVLVDEVEAEGEDPPRLVGRTFGEAPEIDPVVYVDARAHPDAAAALGSAPHFDFSTLVGRYVSARIVSSDGYDLHAEIAP